MGLYDRMQKRKLGGIIDESDNQIEENNSANIDVNLDDNHCESINEQNSSKDISSTNEVEIILPSNEPEIVIDEKIDIKNKLTTSNQLEEIIKGMKYLDRQINHDTFYLAHCFLKIKEDRLFVQKGYEYWNDFLNAEIKDYSRKSVFNFLSVAEVFPLETTTDETLELGMTRLIEISNIKEKTKRIKFLEENSISDLKSMSTRELREKVRELNTNSGFLLTDKFEQDFKENINSLKDATIKFTSLLDNLARTGIEEKSYVTLKDEIKEIENYIKSVKEKIDKKLKNLKSVVDYTLDSNNSESDINE